MCLRAVAVSHRWMWFGSDLAHLTCEFGGSGTVTWTEVTYYHLVTVAPFLYLVRILTMFSLDSMWPADCERQL